MKKYLNIKTILLVISILIIVAGIVNIFINDFNKSLEYKAATRIEVYIEKGYEKQEIINIAKETFQDEEILFYEVEKLNQVAGIKVGEYSKEELESYIDKIAEKYNIDKEKMEYYEISIPETKTITIVKPYILPLLFITTLSLIYIIIKNYRSNNVVRISLRILGILVITLGIYFSLISLLKLQFSIYTMPLALAIYIVSMLIAINKKCE